MADRKIVDLTEIDGIVSGDWLVVGDVSDSDIAKKASPDAVRSGLSLGNVTNDAQLKRSSADFASFTAKGTPASADLLLIEDSAASNAKKQITAGSLLGMAPRLYSATTLGTLTPDINSYDFFRLTAQTGGTLTIAAPTGTHYAGRRIGIQVHSQVNPSVAITWNAVYVNTDLITKATAVLNTTDMLYEFVYDSNRAVWVPVSGGVY